MEADGMKSQRIKGLPVSELDDILILSSFFYKRTQEKLRRVRASNLNSNTTISLLLEERSL